jgi:hypothetical protein
MPAAAKNERAKQLASPVDARVAGRAAERIAKMIFQQFTVAILVASAASALAAEKPLSPMEARKKVGQSITVEMTVRAAKDRLEQRGEIYLDSELNFRDGKNFAVVITKAGAASLKNAGIADPARHFQDRNIRATGTVKEVDRVPRIEVDAAKQIRLVEGK